jgi:hypothetical protein
MSRISPCALPADSLLRRYVDGVAYTDCYRAALAFPVSFPTYVEAFYSTPLFKLERLVLRMAVARGSTDAQARELGNGTREDFAAWTVEARAEQQLLLRDFLGRTRSWLMIAPVEASGMDSCWLYFGSAVVPAGTVGAAQPSLGTGFTALLGAHRLYSRALLGAARRRLRAQRPTHPR